MRTFLRNVSSNAAGQALLLAVLLGALLLIAGGAILYMSQVGNRHQMATGQRSKLQSVAEVGLADITQQLSVSLTVWQNALGGVFTNTDCNTGNLLQTPAGNAFKVYCSTGNAGNPNLQTYQVAVTGVAYGLGSEAQTPVRAVKAYLSQRTLGTDLATDLHVAAALQLVSVPAITGILNVHWGPIVCLDSNTWTLPDLIESQRYPRKFSQGGLTGPTALRSGPTSGAGPKTDQKEYVAYVSQTFVPLINESNYLALAQNEDSIIAPTDSSGHSLTPTCGSGHSQCGYFLTPGATAYFDGNYSAPAGSVIYVDGPVQFNKVGMDGVSFITTKDLTVTDNTGGSDLSLQVPVSAPSEYPYAPGVPTSWPCSNNVGGNCNSTNVFPNSTHVDFRGFLYVKGNFNVAVSSWNMVGALMVGDTQASSSGKLTIPNGDSLNLAYDDQINHNIQMNPVSGTTMKIEPDLVQDVPVF